MLEILIGILIGVISWRIGCYSDKLAKKKFEEKLLEERKIWEDISPPTEYRCSTRR